MPDVRVRPVVVADNVSVLHFWEYKDAPLKEP